MVGTMGVLSAAGAKATIQGELLRDFPPPPSSSVIWGGRGDWRRDGCGDSGGE